MFPVSSFPMFPVTLSVPVTSDDSSSYDSSTDLYSESSEDDISLSSEMNVDNIEIEDKTEYLSIYYTNADSVLNKKNELELEVHLTDPDFVIISETYPKNISSTEISDAELKLAGYNLLKATTNPKSRGVCILYKSNIKVKDCKLLNDFKFEESCWCSVILENNKTLLLGAIYRSCSSNVTNSLKLFQLITNAIDMKFDYNIIVGDFNFPTINWENWCTPHNETHIEFKFIECLRDNFLQQLINEPTRRRFGQAENILDLVIVDKPEIVCEIKYRQNLGASDHVGLFVKLNCNTLCESIKCEKPNFFKGDYEIINKDLSQVNWDFAGMSVNDSANLLTNEVNKVINDHVPLKRIGARRKQKWMDNECIKRAKMKYHTFIRYIHTRTHHNYRKYIAARNAYSKISRQTKRRFENSLVDNMNNNPKSFWSYVRDKVKSRVGISDLKNENGDLVKDNEGKANLLNNFFTSVFVKESLETIPIFNIRYHGEPITTIVTDVNTVHNKLLTLNPYKSMGVDGLHPKFLRETANVLSEPMTDIMNKSYATGDLPDMWKMANITAIYKNKGEKSDPSNHRPISNTCIPCKLSEGPVKDVLMNHMLSNNLFSDSQFGFRRKRNCILQLLNTLDNFTKAYDNNHQTDAIYLDIKKAFDTVPHERLLLKLKAYGIEDPLLLWIRNFLQDRKQRVCVGDSKSEWKDITSGVPQGSVLGPTLFVIYINDLPDVVESVCKIFADDTKLYREIYTPADQLILQEDLLSLCKWSEDWLLEFSIPKCKILQYGHVKHDFEYEMKDIDMNHIKLPNVKEEKDLGIIFQENLKFDKHINSVVNKTKRLTGLIKRTFSCMNKKMFLTLYKSLIRSIVDYGSTVYYPYTKKNSQLIENIQRRATRIVPQLKGLSYTERLQALNLPTLLYRRERFDLIQIFKIVNHLEDIDSSKFFTFNDNPTRGHIFQIYKPNVNKSLRQNTFPLRCIDSWNKLDENIVLSESVLEFKSKLDIKWRHKRFKIDSIY